MKKLGQAVVRGLKHLVHHATDNYYTRTSVSASLGYEEYHLYREHRVFFIKLMVLKETKSSLGKQRSERNYWYYNYPNIKELN